MIVIMISDLPDFNFFIFIIIIIIELQILKQVCLYESLFLSRFFLNADTLDESTTFSDKPFHVLIGRK